MHSEKIKQLEKALQNPAATPEMKAKFQDAIDKLKAEEKPVKKETTKEADRFYIVHDERGYRLMDRETGLPLFTETHHAGANAKKYAAELNDGKITLAEFNKLRKAAKKANEPRPKKQAEVVKKAIAATKAPETNHAAEMQALIDNATKSSEAWSHNKVLAEAQKFEALRSKSAQTQDAKGDSKKRLTPTRENLIRWMNNPGGFDLIGIDTFKAGDATADLKIKKEVFWNRFNIHYKH